MLYNCTIKSRLANRYRYRYRYSYRSVRFCGISAWDLGAGGRMRAARVLAVRSAQNGNTRWVYGCCTTHSVRWLRQSTATTEDTVLSKFLGRRGENILGISLFCGLASVSAAPSVCNPPTLATLATVVSSGCILGGCFGVLITDEGVSGKVSVERPDKAKYEVEKKFAAKSKPSSQSPPSPLPHEDDHGFQSLPLDVSFRVQQVQAMVSAIQSEVLSEQARPWVALANDLENAYLALSNRQLALPGNRRYQPPEAALSWIQSKIQEGRFPT